MGFSYDTTLSAACHALAEKWAKVVTKNVLQNFLTMVCIIRHQYLKFHNSSLLTWIASLQSKHRSFWTSCFNRRYLNISKSIPDCVKPLQSPLPTEHLEAMETVYQMNARKNAEIRFR